MSEPEIGKSIDNFNDYEVSNYGRVKSLKKSKIKMLSGYIQDGPKGGYERFYFFVNGVKKAVSGHILTAIAFVPNPNNLPEVNHLDNNRANNFYKNLEWVTRKGNCEYAAKQKRYNVPKGENNHFSKVSQVIVLAIRNSIDTSRKQLALKYGIHKDTVGDILRRKTWKHI